MTEDLATTLGLLTLIYAAGFWCSAMLDLPKRSVIWWPISLAVGSVKLLHSMIWTEKR